MLFKPLPLQQPIESVSQGTADVLLMSANPVADGHKGKPYNNDDFMGTICILTNRDGINKKDQALG